MRRPRVSFLRPWRTRCGACGPARRGGPVAPPLRGWLADSYHSMAICFVLPLVGFVATTVLDFLYPRLLAMSARAA